MMPDVLNDWRARLIVATVRINPLEDLDGLQDLDAAIYAGADAILIPKANTKEQILLLQKRSTIWKSNMEGLLAALRLSQI